MCKYCDELNAETEEIRIDEIFINRAGNFGYKCTIKHCPACGTMLKKYEPKKDNTCKHKDVKGKHTIEYDSTYEMRSSDMHCTQCGKSGSREELIEDSNK